MRCPQKENKFLRLGQAWAAWGCPMPSLRYSNQDVEMKRISCASGHLTEPKVRDHMQTHWQDQVRDDRRQSSRLRVDTKPGPSTPEQLPRVDIQTAHYGVLNPNTG